MKKKQANQPFNVPLLTPVFQGHKRLRIALVGMPNSGKSTLFQAVSATSIYTGELTGTHRTYEECPVQIGFDEARLVDLPSIQSLNNLPVWCNKWSV
jgi:ferrous iron transport protein B